MHQSIPISIHLRNFGSIGPEGATFEFKAGKLVGVVGQNGTGKSTLFAGLRWMIAGKTNPSKLSDMVNWYSGKPASGRLIWLGRGGVRYVIDRTFHTKGTLRILEGAEEKPVGGRLRVLESFIEDEIIGMPVELLDRLCLLDEERFRGFANMDSRSFRSLIEASFNLERIQNMLKKAKKKHTSASKDAEVVRDSMNRKLGQIEIAEKMVSNSPDDNEILLKKEQHAKDELKTLSTKLKQLDITITKYSDEISRMNRKRPIDSVEDAEERRTTLLRQAKYDLSSVQQKLKFFEDNDRCEMCTQDINGDTKSPILERLTESISNFKSTIKSQNKYLSQINAWLSKYDTICNKLSESERDKKILISKRDNIKKTIELIRDGLSKDSSLKNEKIDVDSLYIELRDLEFKHETLIYEVKQWGFLCKVVLSDGGLKRHLIHKFIPELQRFTNSILQDFAFDYLSIEMDDDMRVSVVNNNNVRPFSRCSGGAKFRINIALLYGYILAIREFHNVCVPIHLLDEILNGSLDSDGVEMFLSVVRRFSEENSVPVFIISHTLDSSVYDQKIEVTRKGRFSEYSIS